MTNTILKSDTMNIFREFEHIAKSHSVEPAVFFKVNKQFMHLSYAVLYQRAVVLGQYLYEEGVSNHQKVVLLIASQPEWPIAFMAVQYCKAIAVPLDTKLPAHEIARLIIHSQAKVVLCTFKLDPEVKKFIEGLSDVRMILVDSPEFLEAKEIARKPPDDEETPSANTIAAMFYTSGTTDVPKAVMLSHENLLANVASLKKLKVVTSKDVVISFLPLHHTYSFMVTCLLPISIAAKISYPASMNSDDLLECIKKTGVSVLVGVPQFFFIFHKAIKQRMGKQFFLLKIALGLLVELCWMLRRGLKVNLSKLVLFKLHQSFGSQLRFMVSGGAKSEPSIVKDFFKWGFTLLEGYGLTETSPVVTLNPPAHPKIGSVGKAIPDVEVKLLNKDQEGVGEVAIRGANVMVEYYQMPVETKAVLSEGWFLTEDLGYFDKEGYLYITGRRDDMIVLPSGKKINPEEIEKSYNVCPYIKEICVVSGSKSGFVAGEKQLMAVIVPDEEYFRSRGLVNIEEKITWELDNLSHHLSSYKRIKGFVINKERLPRTTLGKIMRNRIKQSFFDSTAQSLEKKDVLTQEEFDQLPMGTCRKVLDYLSSRLKKPVHLGDHIELELGLDSLARIELLLELQKVLNIEVPEHIAIDLFQAYTIKDLLFKIQPYLPKEITEMGEEGLTWPELIREDPGPRTLANMRIVPTLFDKIFTVFWVTVFKVMMKVFHRIEKEGARFPSQGPYIIFGNHTSYLDPVVIAACLPYTYVMHTYFIGFRQIFDNAILKSTIKPARFLPIDSTINLVDSLQAMAYLLKKNKVICLFPEGQRAPTEEVIRFKKGIGILAKEINCTLVPVYIDGAFKAWPRFNRFPHPAKIKIRVGKAVTLNDLVSDESKQDLTYEIISEMLRQELLKLKPVV